ncbi:energy-coupling factor transporter transmembrane component T [Bacillota bacterium LX-D]|nr:energy-coupling factor transporter transmembrane component T [Bacillota bacterium LX-D]
MLIYRAKHNLIHQLHPLTALSFIVVVTFLALLFSHPVYLFGLLLVTGLVLAAAENLREWKPYLEVSLGMLVIIMLVNSCLVHVGTTVLWNGPNVPVIGRIRITLEALCYGAAMGVRLLVIISIFCLYTYAVHPDKVLKLFSRLGNKSVLAITMGTRLFPLMLGDVLRITEVQRCRGAKLDTGSFMQKVKNRLPIINVLLLSSLESSLQTAEAMQARGYGSGKRTYYSRELWRPRDSLIMSATVLAFLLGLWSAWQGWANYTYYPRLENITRSDFPAAAVLIFLLAIPAFLSWGCKKWPRFKSKI